MPPIINHAPACDKSAPSRRHLLRFAAGAAALAVLPVSAVSAPIRPDPLVALYRDCRRSLRRVLRLSDQIEAVEHAARRAGYEVYGRAIMVADRWPCWFASEIRNRCQPLDPDGPSVEVRDSLLRQLRASRAKVRRQRIAAGLGAMDAKHSEAWERYGRVRDALISTPALGPEGLAIKARWLLDDLHNGENEHQKRMARAILADALRLAGGAA